MKIFKPTEKWLLKNGFKKEEVFGEHYKTKIISLCYISYTHKSLCLSVHKNDYSWTAFSDKENYFDDTYINLDIKSESDVLNFIKYCVPLIKE